MFKITAVLLAYSSTVMSAPHLQTEDEYNRAWCLTKGGKAEAPVEYQGVRARVDCLTETHAWEMDFTAKMTECIGQAFQYAEMTGKAPGCVLIIESMKQCPRLELAYDMIHSTAYGTPVLPGRKMRRMHTIKFEGIGPAFDMCVEWIQTRHMKPRINSKPLDAQPGKGDSTAKRGGADDA